MKHEQPNDKNELFVSQTQRALDDNIHDINGNTRQALHAIREQALLQPAKKSFFSGPRAAVLLAVLSAAVVLVPVSRFQTADISPQVIPHTDDIDLLQSEETFEMLSNLDMYQWLILEEQKVKS